jgi:type IV secretion system protein VirB8
MKAIKSFFKKRKETEDLRNEALKSLIELNQEKHEPYEAAQSWFTSSIYLLETRIKLFQTLSLGLGALLTLSILAIITLCPLKTVQAFVFSSNERTGEISELLPISQYISKPNWAVTHKLLADYITDRESYNFIDLKRSYTNINNFSNQTIAMQFNQSFSEDNPENLIKRYGRNTYVTTHIISINPMDALKNEVLAKFDTETFELATSRKIDEQHFSAVIQYEYGKTSKNSTGLNQNPLGFKVIFYNKQLVA